jgi:hypothetical protein
MDLSAWQEIGAVMAIGGVLAGLFWRLQAQVTECQRALDNFRVEVAQKYVTNEAIGRVEGQLYEGFRAMRSEMESLREALMRVLERGK